MANINYNDDDSHEKVTMIKRIIIFQISKGFIVSD